MKIKESKLILNDTTTYIRYSEFELNKVVYYSMFTKNKNTNTYTIHFKSAEDMKEKSKWIESNITNEDERQIYNYMVKESDNETIWMA